MPVLEYLGTAVPYGTVHSTARVLQVFNIKIRDACAQARPMFSKQDPAAEGVMQRQQTKCVMLLHCGHSPSCVVWHLRAALSTHVYAAEPAAGLARGQLPPGTYVLLIVGSGRLCQP